MSDSKKKPQLAADHPAVVTLEAQAQALIDKALAMMVQAGKEYAITIVMSDPKDEITVFRTNVVGAPASLRGYLHGVLDDVEGKGEGYVIKPVHLA